MKNLDKKISKAFTLAELLMVLAIVGVILVLILSQAKTVSTNYTNKYMYYSAYTNLSAAVNKITTDGCTATELASGGICYNLALPNVNSAAGSRGFCDRLAELFNVVGNVYCSNTGISNPAFTTTNGMKFYNESFSPAANFYRIYVDIDGPRRNSQVGVDIQPFIINAQDGTFNPDPTSTAAQNIIYLSAGVQYTDSGTNLVKWVSKNASYRDAYCIAHGSYPNPSGATCPASDTALYTANCSSNTCSVVVSKPGFMFFSR